jgi:HSP20 family protein
MYDPWPTPMREMLEQMLSERGQRGGGPVPMPVNAYEEDGAVVLEASMPGVQPEDVELSCVDNVLTIKGQAHVREREYLHQEIRGLEYARRIPLPGDCRFDAAEASAEHGLVRIRIPKARPRAPEKIRIQITRKEPS